MPFVQLGNRHAERPKVERWNAFVSWLTGVSISLYSESDPAG